MEKDKIKELKNMHTKGELAKMYLEARKELIEEFEKILSETRKVYGSILAIQFIEDNLNLMEVKNG